MDGVLVESFPYKNSWVTLEEAPGKDVTLLIPAIQLEVASFQHNFAFMVRLPSHTFAGAMEGLCGDCNNDATNDMRRSDGEVCSKYHYFPYLSQCNVTNCQDDFF